MTMVAEILVFALSIFTAAINSQNNDPFALCHKLNEYGCNPTAIPDIVEIYINSGVDGYTLPTNPCDFDSINMTWIWTQVDIGVLDLVSDNSYFSTIPCQVLIQMPDTLSQRDILHLIQEDYYFNDANTAECDTSNVENNPYNVTLCTYNTTNNTSDDNSTSSYDSCPNDDRCIYPFELTYRETSNLADFGMCHCAVSCTFRPFSADIRVLDTFNTCCSAISLVLIVGYFLNSCLELKRVRKFEQTQKLSDLPLTFDIPFICVTALLCLDLCLLSPSILGKEYFTCSPGSKDTVHGEHLPGANWPCFIQGSVLYLSFSVMYNYFMLLSFAVWRYVYRPMKPLFGIKKRWWHLAMCTYILGFFIGFVSQVPEASIGVNPILGLCGSSLTATRNSYIFNWYPIMLTVVAFCIITPMTVYKIWQVIRHKDLMNESLDMYNRELIHLSTRLVLYSCFLCGSCVCFLYVIGEVLFNMDDWERILADYVECLVLENYLSDIGLGGDSTQCVLDPNNELPIANYYMQGVVIILASSASFILSCSNARYADWKRAETRMIRMISRSSRGDSGDDSGGSMSRQKTLEMSEVDFSKTDVSNKQSGRRVTAVTQTSQIDSKTETTQTETAPKLETANSNIDYATTPDIDQENQVHEFAADFVARNSGLSASIPTTSISSMSGKNSNDTVELIKTNK